MTLKSYPSSELKKRGIYAQKAAKIQRSETADERVSAPALDAIKPDYDTLQYNYTVFSPYIGASDEVDRLWANLFNGHSILSFYPARHLVTFPPVFHTRTWRLIRRLVGVFSIGEDTLDRVGASRRNVRLPEESGGGYMAYLEIFHLLHCVVSKYTFL